jgi:hypothetical protein
VPRSLRVEAKLKAAEKSLEEAKARASDAEDKMEKKEADTATREEDI